MTNVVMWFVIFQMIELHHMTSNKKSFSLARDELGGSTCSLSSRKSHSLSPAHSRQNSTASLLEIGVENPATTGMVMYGFSWGFFSGSKFWGLFPVKSHKLIILPS